MRLEHFLLTAELTFPVSVFMSKKGKIRVCNSTLWIPCSSGYELAELASRAYLEKGILTAE